MKIEITVDLPRNQLLKYTFAVGPNVLIEMVFFVVIAVTLIDINVTGYYGYSSVHSENLKSIFLRYT